jgi:PAS domain S-box-containing protein
MNLLAAASMIVAVISILGVYYFAMKGRRITEKLRKMLVALNPSKEGLSSQTIDEIITEIDAMRLQNLRLEAIVEATPFPMLITDPSANIVSANQAGFKLLEIDNMKSADFVGQSVSAFFYNDPNRPSVTAKVIESRTAIRGIEASLQTRKNRTIHVLVDSGPILAKTGELLGAFSIAVDVTRQKMAELDVKAKNESLARMRSDAETMSAQLAASIEEFQNTVKEIQKQVAGNEDIAKSIHGFMEQLKGSFAEFDTTLTPVISGTELLNQDLKDIQGATATIKTISEQTDILALNARIEAERSSSSGGSSNEGFKIVAKEVKDLAIKAKEITGEIMNINGHISEVLGSSSSSLALMKQKFDGITRDLSSNTTSQDLAAVSSEIRNMLFQVDTAISDMSRSAASLNAMIRDA